MSYPSKWSSAFQKAAVAFIIIVIGSSLLIAKYSPRRNAQATRQWVQFQSDVKALWNTFVNIPDMKTVAPQGHAQQRILSWVYASRRERFFCAFPIEISYKSIVSRIPLEKSIWALLLSEDADPLPEPTSFSVLSSNVAQQERFQRWWHPTSTAPAHGFTCHWPAIPFSS